MPLEQARSLFHGQWLEILGQLMDEEVVMEDSDLAPRQGSRGMSCPEVPREEVPCMFQNTGMIYRTHQRKHHE